MAKLQCECGAIMSDSIVPSEIVFHVLSDFEFDKLLSQDKVEVLKFSSLFTKVWKCLSCQRIYVFSNDGKVKAVYNLEHHV